MIYHFTLWAKAGKQDLLTKENYLYQFVHLLSINCRFRSLWKAQRPLSNYSDDWKLKCMKEIF